MRVNEGDRVRVTGIMPSDPDPMEVGAEGTVTYVSEQFGQYGVAWDNGRSLMLLQGDPFTVIGHRSDQPAVEWLVVHDPTNNTKGERR